MEEGSANLAEAGRVNLTSKEGDVFSVPAPVAKLSKIVVESMGEDDDDEDNDDSIDIPLPNVSSDVLRKVIDFCEHYHSVEKMDPIQTPLKYNKLEDLVQPWYSDFVKVDRNMLFDLVAAANFMDIKPLLDLTCLAVSILIKGKSAPELREMFNIAFEADGEGQPQQQQQQQDGDRNQVSDDEA